MKKKLGNAFLILLFVGVLMYFLITAVMDLTNKKDLHTMNLAGAFELLEVEHSINGLIPVGTDYYYIGIEEASYDAYIIKASKKWLEKNFDSNHMAKEAGGIRITALAGKVSDYKISRELYSRVVSMEELNYPLGTEYCLNMGYMTDAMIKLMVVVLCVILVITGIYFVKNKGEVKSLFAKCWLVGMIITILLMLRCIISL